VRTGARPTRGESRQARADDWCGRSPEHLDRSPSDHPRAGLLTLRALQADKAARRRGGTVRWAVEPVEYQNQRRARRSARASFGASPGDVTQHSGRSGALLVRGQHAEAGVDLPIPPRSQSVLDRYERLAITFRGSVAFQFGPLALLTAQPCAEVPVLDERGERIHDHAGTEL
jgi:hypothetical protein